ncbi:MAG: hypothetical protein ABI834_02210 [Ginsengibacter sp.]
MYSRFKINIVATCILVCSFGSAAEAQQLASSKALNEIYNKKITEKLSEENKSKQSGKSLQKEQNLPSMQSSLKDVAKIKIKNPEIVSHDYSTLSDEEKKNKLPSNSPKLKQIGKPLIKHSKFYSR